MASDEIGAIKSIEFQNEVLAEVGVEVNEELKREAWRWVIENDVNPRHLENSLIRYSTNFSPAAGGNPLVLGMEPPEDLENADEFEPEKFDLEYDK